MDLNERLIKLRHEKGVTQSYMAEYLEVVPSNYNGYESGRRTPPADKLAKLADFFGVSVDYLIGRTDERSIIGVDTSDMTNREQQLLKAYEQLSADESDYAKKIKAKIDTLLGIDESEDGQ